MGGAPGAGRPPPPPPEGGRAGAPYHTYSHDEALQGIAEAGYTAVELSAVPGWTEHVDLDADQDELRRKLAGYGLEPVSLSAHSDLTTADGLAHGIKAERWAAD